MRDYRDVTGDETPADREKLWREFECPDCNAHNPMDDGFRIGDEVLCNYCGMEYVVKERGSSYVLREL